MSREFLVGGRDVSSPEEFRDLFSRKVSEPDELIWVVVGFPDDRLVSYEISSSTRKMEPIDEGGVADRLTDLMNWTQQNPANKLERHFLIFGDMKEFVDAVRPALLRTQGTDWVGVRNTEYLHKCLDELVGNSLPRTEIVM